MNLLLDSIITFNFTTSVILIVQVLRHYFFFLSGAPSEIKDALRRVFLADFLMAASVFAFNMVDDSTLGHGLEVEVLLKLIQASSIIYALHANYNLYIAVKEIGD